MKPILLIPVFLLILSCARQDMEFVVVDPQQKTVENAVVIIFPAYNQHDIYKIGQSSTIKITDKHGLTNLNKNSTTRWKVAAYSPDMKLFSEPDIDVFNPRTKLRLHPLTKPMPNKNDDDDSHDYTLIAYFYPIKKVLLENKSDPQYANIRAKAIEGCASFLIKNESYPRDLALRRATIWMDNMHISTPFERKFVSQKKKQR